MAKRGGDTRTADLFTDHPLFPVRVPSDLPRAMDFRVRIAKAISKALKECPKSRAQIAAEASEILGDTLSENMLNNYAAPSHDGHDISLTRFKAIARVTGQNWLWEVALEGEGLTLLEGKEAIYAQYGLAKRTEKEATDRRKALESLVGEIEGKERDQ